MEPLENGLLPIGFAESDAAVNDELGGYGGSYFYDADPADNALQYVEQMTVESLGGIVAGRTARASFKDLVVYGEQDRRVIARGDWRLKFEMAFEDAAIDLAAGQSMRLGSKEATVDVLSASPIALYVEYTVDGLMNCKD